MVSALFSSPARRSLLGLVALGAVLAVVGLVVLDGGRSPAHPATPPHVVVERLTPPPGTPLVTVGSRIPARAIQPGFVGLSLEFPAVEGYAGSDPSAVNPVLVQLIRNLAPGQAPSLRIGGDSTDWTWWPIPHMAKPGGARYTLGTRWLGVVHSLARSLGARLIMGVDMEAGSRVVANAEARAFVHGIGRQSIAALELGNEPELYASFPWYHTHDGTLIRGRPPGYDFSAFIQDFATLTSGLPKLPIAGPAIGSPGWMAQVGGFVSAEPRLAMVTLHRYPLQLCFMPAASPMYPTLGHLFAPPASRGLADSVAQLVATSHAHHLLVRIDEMNSVSCGGAPGLSNSFASALWSIDALFQMARVGVDGVNFHTFPSATYALFKFKHAGGTWHALVEPEYYGLMLFAQAAPPGSHLLRVRGVHPSSLKAWATRATDGWTRVVLINEGFRPRYVTLRGPSLAGAATLQQLRAPRLRSQLGVSFGGQSFGPSSDTGTLSGTPQLLSVSSQRGYYVVRVPSASAAMISFAPAARAAP
jgi:hypothetical protein